MEEEMKKVEIEIVKAHELDPNKKYLIEVPNRSYTMEEAHGLAKTLDSMGVKGVVAIPRGDESIIIKELPGGKNEKNS